MFLSENREEHIPGFIIDKLTNSETSWLLKVISDLRRDRCTPDTLSRLKGLFDTNGFVMAIGVSEYDLDTSKGNYPDNMVYRKIEAAINNFLGLGMSCNNNMVDFLNNNQALKDMVRYAEDIQDRSMKLNVESNLGSSEEPIMVTIDIMTKPFLEYIKDNSGLGSIELIKDEFIDFPLLFDNFNTSDNSKISVSDVLIAFRECQLKDDCDTCVLTTNRLAIYVMVNHPAFDLYINTIKKIITLLDRDAVHDFVDAIIS